MSRTETIRLVSDLTVQSHFKNIGSSGGESPVLVPGPCVPPTSLWANPCFHAGSDSTNGLIAEPLFMQERSTLFRTAHGLGSRVSSHVS